MSVHTIGIGRGERVQVQVSPFASAHCLFVACRFAVFFAVAVLCGAEDNVRLVCVETTLDPVSLMRRPAITTTHIL